MRIISYNVNGIRAAFRKGFTDWLATDPADIICLQETKATREDVECHLLEELGYGHHWYSAQKKGYSGVAILSRIKPDKIFTGNRYEQSDFEGRVIRADFGNLSIINAYFPSGTTGEIRQAYKYQWLDEFYDYIQELRKKRRKLVIAGDYNIAHKAIDLHDPKSNVRTSGFLPEERAWMDKWFDAKMIDSFRHLHPEATGAYSWWTQRFPSVRLNNKGWRLDYLSVTKNLAGKIKSAGILPEVKHSDHCPVFVEIDA